MAITARLQLPDRASWRAWLQENGRQSEGIWLVLGKKSGGGRGLLYEDALQEALCFGWIDSQARPGDAETYLHQFTPRRERSVWSLPNRARVRALIAGGQMTPAGLAVVRFDLAGEDRDDEALPPEQRPWTLPDELRRALEAAPPAWDFFQSLTETQRRRYLGLILSAKQEATRARRAAGLVKAMQNRQKPDRLG